MSLRQKTVAGLSWAFGQQFSVQIINFMVSVVLARLLSPAEFGLVAMLSIFIAVGNILIDSGLTSSLIRTPNPDEEDYSTVFFINILAGVLIYLILFFTAPLIARFFNQPILDSIIKVYCLSFIIKSFSAIQNTRLTKLMEFKKQMLIQIPSVVIGGLIGILLAFNGYGVWSLVWMNLVQAILFTIQHWFYTRWKPIFVFNKAKLKTHFNFGYKLTLSGLLDTLYQNLYNILIAKYFSAAQLGFYNRAQSLRQLPVQNISEALNKVTYPMFAAIQHDDEKLRNAYKKLMLQVMFWLTPIMLIMTLLAEPLIRFLFTEKWLPAVPYFQILSISGILYPLQAYNLNILNVKGRSDLFFKLEVYKKGFLTVGIFFALQYGIFGLLYFQLISSIISLYINSYYSGKMIDLSFFSQVKILTPVFLIAGLVLICSWFFDAYLIQSLKLPDFIRISLSGSFFMMLYLFISYAVKVSAIEDFKTLVLKK